MITLMTMMTKLMIMMIISLIYTMLTKGIFEGVVKKLHDCFFEQILVFFIHYRLVPKKINSVLHGI